MNKDFENENMPPKPDFLDALQQEITPPSHLQGRVVSALKREGLLPEEQKQPLSMAWLSLRVTLAAAACLFVFTAGVLLGRSDNVAIDSALSSLIGNETDLYAVLLYETQDYSVAGPEEELGLYQEYNRWIAQAREREQFVTGEDLEVDRGWLVAPAAESPRIEPATAIAANAPLSGIFFLRANSDDEVLSLVQEIPHVRFGGQVLVQKTIPTRE